MRPIRVFLLIAAAAAAGTILSRPCEAQSQIEGAVWRWDEQRRPQPLAGQKIFLIPVAQRDSVLGEYCRLNARLRLSVTAGSRRGRISLADSVLAYRRNMTRAADSLLARVAIATTEAGIDGRFHIAAPTGQLLLVAVSVNIMDSGGIPTYPFNFVWAIPISNQAQLNLSPDTQLDPVCP